MFIDKENLVSNAQAVTAAAKSTDTIDLSEGRAIGNIEMNVTVDEAVTAGGAATVEVQLRTSDNDDMSSADIVVASGPIAKDDLTAGRPAIKLQVPNQRLKRYVDVYYDVATGPLTAGKFSAGLVLQSENTHAYPNAI